MELKLRGVKDAMIMFEKLPKFEASAVQLGTFCKSENRENDQL